MSDLIKLYIEALMIGDVAVIAQRRAELMESYLGILNVDDMIEFEIMLNGMEYSFLK